MGIFSKFKKKGKFNLSKSDFKPKNIDFEVLSVKFSDGFFQKFPQAKKKNNYIGKNSLITKTTSISLFGNRIGVMYDPSEIELIEDKFIDKINQNLNWIADNENGIKSGIAEKLLSLKNENWLEENETKLSESEFIKRIKLNAVSFFGNGNSELIFDDGDLFWEHQIVANLNTKNKLTDINIRG